MLARLGRKGWYVPFSRFLRSKSTDYRIRSFLFSCLSPQNLLQVWAQHPSLLQKAADTINVNSSGATPGYLGSLVSSFLSVAPLLAGRLGPFFRAVVRVVSGFRDSSGKKRKRKGKEETGERGGHPESRSHVLFMEMDM